MSDTPKTDAERFLSYTKQLDNGCIIWTGGYRGRGRDHGYGAFRLNGKTVPAHRARFILDGVQLSSDQVIDHICRNRGCVNIDHLRIVTHQQNSVENSSSLPAKNRLKTHCVNGHPFDDENTSFRPNGHRTCRECKRIEAYARFIRKRDQSREATQP